MCNKQRYSVPPQIARLAAARRRFCMELRPGESRQVTVTADPPLLARFDGTAGKWRIAEGTHQITLARSAEPRQRSQAVSSARDETRCGEGSNGGEAAGWFSETARECAPGPQAG
jgi:Fibronectin type III-like domain